MEVSAGFWPHGPEHHPAPPFSLFFGDGRKKKAISGGHRIEQPTSSKPSFFTCKTIQSAISLQLAITVTAGKGGTTFPICQVPIWMSPPPESPLYFFHKTLFFILISINFSEYLLITCYVPCSVLYTGSALGAQNSKMNKILSLSSRWGLREVKT